MLCKVWGRPAEEDPHGRCVFMIVKYFLLIIKRG